MGDLPGILSGRPLFDRPLEIVRPLLPKLETIQLPLDQAMASGQLTNNGQHVRKLESELAAYLNVRHALCVGNATVGLMLLLKALSSDGRVILPSYTFPASAHAAVWAGLQLVFADILPDTYTLSPDSVASLITKETVAIMGVHIYGHACEIEELQAVADQQNIPLIFDAAHATGSLYRGRQIGSCGLAEVFSFHATKMFPVGEGGAITTNDDDLAAKLRLLRTFGGSPGEENTRLPGLNGKMQEFNALLGLENLKVIDQHVTHRRTIAALIKDDLDGISGLIFQQQQPFAYSNYQNLSVLIEADEFGLDRDQLCLALRGDGIGARKYFYPPLHKHDAYRYMEESLPQPLPVTESVSERVLCLPIYSQMTDSEAKTMCTAIHHLHQHADAIRNHISNA
jgi:dTDP-4-amino-4,6-dideoxygalactose transaminase